MDVVLIALLVLLVVGSLIALELRNLLSAVIAVGVVGLGLSIVFLLLGAPDIAITQVVVEVIVVTVLIRLTGRTGRTVDAAPDRRDAVAVWLGGGVLLMLLGLMIHVLSALPRFGSGASLPAGHYLENAPAQTGASNVVTAILLDYRAYDTLGEATVILTAIVGALVVLRHTGRDVRRAPPVPRGGPPGGADDPKPAERELPPQHSAARSRDQEVQHV
ncbi:MAG: DUF4040 domain-containing protein [Planctomycetes bacterium]|nr:DUF4040 domain-containing protein [Planctomycetota bacterium]